MEQKLTPIIKDSFIQFAGAVLQNRALVDVRDCVKPSARQIFYCMYTDKFIHSTLVNSSPMMALQPPVPNLIISVPSLFLFKFRFIALR